MSLVHVVMFKFKPDASAETIKGVCDGLLSLKERCLHPMTYKPYIKSSIGGREDGPERAQRGITHVFVSEFESDEDLKYYGEKDPEHKEFVKTVREVAEILQVVDFKPGVF